MPLVITWRSKLDSLCWEDLLDVYVGTDKRIFKKEDFPLLGLEDLSTLAVHGLNESLTQDERTLLQAQLLQVDMKKI